MTDADPHASACPDPARLSDYLAGRLACESMDELQAHVASCQSCRERAQAQGATAAGQALAPTSAPPLARGVSFGRYLVVDRIGQGGMGVVYTAYDPELDRRIALKVIRTDGNNEARNEALRGRLLREAQAMARLAHPNVVHVYDVGVWEQQVYVAMEWIDGTTLSQWLRAQPRGWREVLDLFVAAGRGLAMAHESGLVHRDFKPDNVLVGLDGRARITDFGLARVASDDSDELEGTPALERSSRDASITRTGALVGTPAYMAPEQIRGEPVDARTDVFAYCVALWEGVFGELPFAGDTVFERFANTCSGQLRRPKPGLAPPWLLRLLERGLQPERAARHPSLDALLSELERRLQARRSRKGIALIAAAVAVTAGVVGYLQVTRPARLCRGAERSFDGIWDAAAQQKIARAFHASGSPLADDAWRYVQRGLDAYRRQWESQWTGACEATHVRGVQSPEQLDLRMQCLDDRLRDARALTELLAEADADVVARAVDATYALAPVASCSDVRALRAAPPPPADAPTRARIAAVQEELARTRALNAGGRYDAGLALSKQLVADAEATRYPTLLAQSLYARGDLLQQLRQLDEARSTLKRAAVVALGGRDPVTAARAYIKLSFIDGFLLERVGDGQDLSALAGALIEGLGGDDELESARLAQLGRIAEVSGRYDDEAADAREALRLVDRSFGANSLRMAPALSALGRALVHQGHADQAVAPLERALELYRANYGPRHPAVGLALYNLAFADSALGRSEAALAADRQAVAIFEAAHGPRHARVADALTAVSRDLLGLRRYAEAVAPAERAIAINSQRKGSFANTAQPIELLGEAKLQLGRPDEAAPLLEQAVARLAATKQAALLAQARWALGRLDWEQRRDRARGVELVREARAGYLATGDRAEVEEIDAWARRNAVSLAE